MVEPGDAFMLIRMDWFIVKLDPYEKMPLVP